MREVKVFQKASMSEIDKGTYIDNKKFRCDGIFHRFFIRNYHTTHGSQIDTAAVIERANGTIITVPVDLIQFKKPLEDR